MSASNGFWRRQIFVIVCVAHLKYRSEMVGNPNPLL